MVTEYVNGPGFAMRDLFGIYLRKSLPETAGKAAMALWSMETSHLGLHDLN